MCPLLVGVEQVQERGGEDLPFREDRSLVTGGKALSIANVLHQKLWFKARILFARPAVL